MATFDKRTRVSGLLDRLYDLGFIIGRAAEHDARRDEEKAEAFRIKQEILSLIGD